MHQLIRDMGPDAARNKTLVLEAMEAVRLEAIHDCVSALRNYEGIQVGHIDAANFLEAKFPGGKVPDWHGCKTGDCPHEKQTECDETLLNYTTQQGDE
jgi:hypothetical protein